MKIQNKKAFTLVELIIVITILSILATIWFMSYQSYTIDARDWKRKRDLWTLRSGLEIYQAKKSTLPDPDPQTVTTLDASWNTISIQWYAWANVLKTLRAAGDIKDLYDNSYYTYSVNWAKTKYQLLWLLENNTVLALNDNKILNETYAVDYASRYQYTVWNKVWIFFTWTTNTPLQEVMSWTLALSWVTTQMRVILSNTDTLVWTWLDLPILIKRAINNETLLLNCNWQDYLTKQEIINNINNLIWCNFEWWIIAWLTNSNNDILLITPWRCTNSTTPICSWWTDNVVYLWNNWNYDGIVTTWILSTTDWVWNSATLASLDADSITAWNQPHIAAKYCEDMSYSWQTDWYLPAKDELNTIYQWKASGKLTGFDTYFYWSSTESSIINRAWNQNFIDWVKYDDNWKFNTQYVRCSRRF